MRTGIETKLTPMLFEERNRARQEPLRRGERLFEFYDTCGRNGYDEFRVVVNNWLLQMRDDDQAEIESRMRNGSDTDFRNGLCELTMHAWILGSGCGCIVHPILPRSPKRPDFAATNRQGDALAYIEVTSVNPPDARVAENNRENPIYNAIDAADLPPGTMLGYDLIRAGADNPPLRPLVRAVERWARENLDAAGDEPVSSTFTAGDWEIELELYVGAGLEPAENAIGVAGLGGGWIAPHADLRNALDNKSRRYGDLGSPYLIVVSDAKDQLWGADRARDTLLEALMGDEVIEVPQGGEPRLARAGNGFWRDNCGPRNRHVSGVLLLPDPDIWKLRSPAHQPLLSINPWANLAVPGPLRSLHRLEVEENRWIVRQGQILADITGIPDPWPPENAN